MKPSRANCSPVPHRHRARPCGAVSIVRRSRLLASRRRRCCPTRAGLFVVFVVLALRGAAICRALIGRHRGTCGAAGRRRFGLRQHGASYERRQHNHRNQKLCRTHLLALSIEVRSDPGTYLIVDLCLSHEIPSNEIQHPNYVSL